MIKLHVGCGANIMPGWENLDMEAPQSVGHGAAWKKWTAPEQLPYEDGSVDFVFTEHFIEHLPLERGEDMIREFARVLKPGGVARISTPDLAVLAHAHSEGNLEFYKPVGFVAVSAAQLLNFGMMSWGHRFTYDEQELLRLLKEAGFSRRHRSKVGASAFPELNKLECRPDLGDLVMEAVK